MRSGENGQRRDETILEHNENELLPYEKCLRYGPQALTDRELIAVILRSGTKGCNCLEAAGRVLAKSGGMGILGLKHMGADTLTEIEGIGKVKAVMLICIGELSARLVRADRKNLISFESSSQVAEYYMEDLRHLERERFMLIMLDNKCALMHESVLSEGTVSYTCISVRDIFRDALKHGAVHLIMLHNHPSGDPSPSKEDIKATAAVSEAGKLIGISLLDHIVIGDNRYFSFKEHNYI
ncbi:MAG: DNA repair protein RadC [Butyrivibrio sp.]|nr:DNA repair protein RadC [Butyrivibrio sp.]